MSDRDEDDDEEMQAQWSEPGVTVVHEFRSGGDAGGGGGGGGSAGSGFDTETTVIYEERSDTDDGPGSVSGLGAAPPAGDEPSIGGPSDGAAAGPQPAAGVPQTRVRVPWSPTPKVALWLTNEHTTRFGIGHPRNTGSEPLYLVAYDADGNNVGGSELLPGQGLDWYHPPPSAVRIGVGHASVEPSADTELSYDTPSW